MGIENRLLGQFDIYARQFDFRDEHISRKYHHSIRVMKHAREIAFSEGLSENLVEAATVAGLLHDYSRFEQWTIYHTFRDANSIDHADRAAEVLFGKNEISKFYENEENYEIIRDSIHYHNKYTLPEGLVGDSLLLSKIVRDADKLDIIEILTWDASLLAETSDSITPAVSESFLGNNMVNSKNTKNSNDWILLSIAMIYDLNFSYSFQYALENELAPGVFKNLKDREKFAPYFAHMETFLRGKVGDR